jgi:hypothetical protein
MPTMKKATWVLVALILVGVLGRLYDIDAPLVGYHHYRQNDNAGLARNFYEGGMNIFYPQVDWRGSSPGYAEAEFQLYNFSVALLYCVFGVQEWLGRAVNILVYLFSALLLFQFARRLMDETSALLAVLFYSFSPLVFYFTRAFQGDPLMALGSLAAVHFFWVWSEEGRPADLVISALGLTTAVLFKPPNLYLGLPLLYLAHRQFGWRLFRKPNLWLYAAVVIVPMIFWYRHAYSLWEVYGNTFGILGRFNKIFWWSLIPLDEHWIRLVVVLLRRLIFEMATPVGLPLLLLGLIVPFRDRDRILIWWIAGFAVYVALVPRGHGGHDYYQLPIMFVVVICMVRGFRYLQSRLSPPPVLAGIVVVSILACSAWYTREMLFVKDAHWDDVRFGERVRALTQPDDKVIFVHRRSAPPQPHTLRHRTAHGEFLYAHPMAFNLSRRHGWSVDEVQASPEFVETLRQRGAGYLATIDMDIFDRHPEFKKALEGSYTPVEVTREWAIYQLDSRVLED